MVTEPPIIEVSITLHFPPLVGVTALDIAELFDRFGGAFRTVQHLPELPPVSLDDDGPKLQFSEAGPDLPRTWFVSEDLRYLIQFQSDRFSLSWRRLGPQQELEYPGYAEVLRRYRLHVQTFSDWVVERFAQPLQISIAEIAFANAIPIVWGDERRRLSKIYTFVSPSTPRRIRSFAARWVEVFDEGTVDVIAGMGGMPDGAPAATLQIASRRTFTNASVDEALGRIDEMRPHMHTVFESVISREFWGREPI